MVLSEATAPIRILIVDDHPVMRAGLAMTLGKQPGFTVCAEAKGVRDGLKAIQESKPDLLLVDLDLEDGNGLDLIRAALASRPDLPCLVLSAHDEDLHAEKALRAGARGYLMKNAGPAQLIVALRSVLAGDVTVSDKVKARLLQRPAEGASPVRVALQTLSDREKEVFRELGRGAAMRHIAEKLCLSVKTVETHVAHIKRKLGVQTAIELRHRAFQARAGLEAP